MKLPATKNHHASGTVNVETVTKNTRTKTELSRENSTRKLGPFCRDEVHARVGASVSMTLARNYHSVNVHVTVNIPAHPTDDGVDEGLAYCFRKANAALDEEIKGAQKALRGLSDSRS